MEEENIKKVPWGILESLAIFFIFLILSFIAPEMKIVTEKISEWFFLDLSLIEIFLIFSLIQFSVFIGYIFLILKGRYRENFKVFFGKKYFLGEIVKHGVTSSIILFLVTMAASIIMLFLFPTTGEVQDIINIFALAGTKKDMFLVFIAASVLAPISEELYFRGFLYKAFRNKYSQGIAIALTSTIFGALHFDLYRFVPFFIAGVILNHVYEKYDNILIPIIAHGTWNGIMVLTFFLTAGS